MVEQRNSIIIPHFSIKRPQLFSRPLNDVPTGRMRSPILRPIFMFIADHLTLILLDFDQLVARGWIS